jgi:hypothetical protein
MATAGVSSFASAGQVAWPWRLGGVVAALAAAALLSLVVAYWVWHWFGPHSPDPVPGEWTDAKVAAIVAAAPFGRARAAPASQLPGNAAAQAAPSTAGELRVLGVFAGTGGEGYALLRLPERGALLVKSGEQISGGTKLEAVYPNAIRIRTRGEIRDIELRQPLAPAGSPMAAGVRAAAAGARPGRPGCVPPAGFSGPVYRLNAELLTGMGARPESWTAILAPVPGALAVRDETGLAAMLGMKAGDRVAQANGIALASIDDVLAVVVKPLVASQQVRLAGTRDGQPREWLFLNAGACPP